MRSKISNVKATDRPYQVWEADLTYIHCGIDGWGSLMCVTYVQENGLAIALICQHSWKILLFVLKMLLKHTRIST
ncbi:MAG TPA: hypothetical protein VJ697_16915 [Nitrososphaeraceae archaeon]|nr:hypothetical protein [Nitrososphaeraceae archaeon]